MLPGVRVGRPEVLLWMRETVRGREVLEVGLTGAVEEEEDAEMISVLRWLEQIG